MDTKKRDEEELNKLIKFLSKDIGQCKIENVTCEWLEKRTWLVCKGIINCRRQQPTLFCY